MSIQQFNLNSAVALSKTAVSTDTVITGSYFDVSQCQKMKSKLMVTLMVTARTSGSIGMYKVYQADDISGTNAVEITDEIHFSKLLSTTILSVVNGISTVSIHLAYPLKNFVRVDFISSNTAVLEAFAISQLEPKVVAIA